MSLAALVRSMAAAGATPEAIAIAIEAVEVAQASSNTRAERKRERDRERLREKRDIARQSHDIEATSHDTPAPSLSPPDPPKPTPTPGGDTTRTREADDFEAFWAAYPRKTAKADARKAFSRAAKKTTAPEMLGGLERAKAGWVDANFIPHPATWLNGERWQDEPSEVIQLTTRKARYDRPTADAKLDAKNANYARAWAGSERAAGRDWEP